MQTKILFSSLSVLLLLSACDRSPTVVNTPPSSTVAVPVPVPGPPGTPGAPGTPGTPGTPGDSGSTTVIVAPQAASAPK